MSMDKRTKKFDVDQFFRRRKRRSDQSRTKTTTSLTPKCKHPRSEDRPEYGSRDVRRNSCPSNHLSLAGSPGNIPSTTTLHPAKPADHLRPPPKPPPAADPRVPGPLLRTTCPLPPEPSLCNQSVTASASTGQSGCRASPTRTTVAE